MGQLLIQRFARVRLAKQELTFDNLPHIDSLCNDKRNKSVKCSVVRGKDEVKL
jgi:hypothetical protein